MSDYFSNLSPSVAARAEFAFDPNVSPITSSEIWEKIQEKDFPQFWTPGEFDFNVGIELAQTPAQSSQPAWTFITAPEDISWSVNNAAQRIDMFGTNAPPVVSGTRGMRELKLGNALVEGFVRNVTIEGKVAALEKLMNYSLNGSDGYVSVPVYQVWANEKSYGGSKAYYIITDVSVKETMRDLTGNATRAYVDISFMEVPEYQVNSGRDQASQTQTGAVSFLESPAVKAAREQSLLDSVSQRQRASQAAADGQADGVKNSVDQNNSQGAKAPEPAREAPAPARDPSSPPEINAPPT